MDFKNWYCQSNQDLLMLADVQRVYCKDIAGDVRVVRGGVPWETGAEMEISRQGIYWGIRPGSGPTEVRPRQPDWAEGAAELQCSLCEGLS